jgi:hypothetical protein
MKNSVLLFARLLTETFDLSAGQTLSAENAFVSHLSIPSTRTCLAPFTGWLKECARSDKMIFSSACRLFYTLIIGIPDGRGCRVVLITYAPELFCFSVVGFFRFS